MNRSEQATGEQEASVGATPPGAGTRPWWRSPTAHEATRPEPPTRRAEERAETAITAETDTLSTPAAPVVGTLAAPTVAVRTRLTQPRRFYMSPVALTRAMGVWTMIVITLITLPDVAMRLARGASLLTVLLPLAVALFSSALFSALASLPLAVVYPVRVDQAGVKATDFWGLPLRMEWGEMIRAERANFLGLPFLKIESTQRRRLLWLPLFMARGEEFRALLAEVAPAGGVVWQWANADALKRHDGGADGVE